MLWRYYSGPGLVASACVSARASGAARQGRSKAHLRSVHLLVVDQELASCVVKNYSSPKLLNVRVKEISPPGKKPNKKPKNRAFS